MEAAAAAEEEEEEASFGDDDIAPCLRCWMMLVPVPADRPGLGETDATDAEARAPITAPLLSELLEW